MANDSIEMTRPVPIFEIFDDARAREFYIDYLGFAVDFEHRSPSDRLQYLGVSRGGLELHLCPHEGERVTPSRVRVLINDVDAFHAELAAKKNTDGLADVVDQPWGFREFIVRDPFGNQLMFCEKK